MRSVSRLIVIAFLIALVLPAVPARAADDVADSPHVEIIMSNLLSDNCRDAGRYFKEIVEERSKGTISIDLFEDNILGDDLVVSQMTMQGDIGITVTAMSPMATMYPDFYAFDAPFMFLDKADAYRKQDGPVGQAILDNLSPLNLKGLTYWESGFRHLTNNRIAAKVPDDIKNMKIRVMTNEIHIATWKALGANPTPMAFAELFTALQQGTVDGEEMPLGVMYGNKFYEVQKYLTMTGHSYTPFIVFMNLEQWDALTPAQQEVILQAAKDSTVYERERSTYYEDIILKNMKEYGMVVTELTAEEKQPWKDRILGSGIYDTIKAQMQHPEYLDELVK